MTHSTQKDWRELCFAVTNESDSPKLILLVQELIETLDKGERRWRHTSCPPTKSRRIRTPVERESPFGIRSHVCRN